MIAKYSKKLLFIFVLLAQVCSGQKVFKIKEGQIEFINLEKGIFIKKGNSYYEIRLQKINDYDKFVRDSKYELQNVTIEEIEAVKRDSSTIASPNIATYDFKNFETKKFTTINHDDNYQFYKYNKNFFGIDFIKDSKQKPIKANVFHYCILDFGNNKKIIYHERGFIIPTKEKIIFLFKEKDLAKSFRNYTISELKSLTTAEVFSLQVEKLRLNENFYKIDSLKNKRVKILDVYNQRAVNKTFDSIIFNDYFVIAYQKAKINLYNYTFQEIKIANLKAVGQERFYPALQIIEGNSVRRINLIGENFNAGDIKYIPDFSNYFESSRVEFKITKENDHFYPYTDNIFSLVPRLASFENRFKLFNADEYETIEFLDENTSITLNSEMMDFSVNFPIMIYAKLKNGKYNLNTIEYLGTENPNNKIVTFNTKLPKNLDDIKLISPQTYFIEKDGLCTLYPIMKKIKYKKLESFQKNFARFELPNGQKGWLDLKGNEYLDN
jgi:hypothetical protein